MAAKACRNLGLDTQVTFSGALRLALPLSRGRSGRRG